MVRFSQWLGEGRKFKSAVPGLFSIVGIGGIVGLIRALLAISVVLAHSYGALFVGGQEAVQLFYVISGFLISFVLIEKQVYTSTVGFYINRYLRLYPLYALVALLTFLMLTFGGAYTGHQSEFHVAIKEAPLIAKIPLIISNVLIFFQDWAAFFFVDGSGVGFIGFESKNPVSLQKSLLVPQAWTLGIELTFYAIAPFVLDGRFKMLVLLLLSLSLRGYLAIQFDALEDPWSYRFFPSELALFLLGAFSHQIILPMCKRCGEFSRVRGLESIVTYFLAVLIVFYSAIAVVDWVKMLVLYVTFALLLPFAFLHQREKAWDRWIGELSFPIYIVHVLVIHVIRFVWQRFDLEWGITPTVLVVFSSIVFAWFLNKLVTLPIEKLRDRFRA